MRIREHESLNFPGWNGIVGIEGWTNKSRDAVSICANRGRYSSWIDWWFNQVFKPTAKPEHFKKVYRNTETLEIKIWNSVLKICPAELKGKLEDENTQNLQDRDRRLPG